eukprot:COSAG06_NODE_67310_length_252_cov_0.679739_1_plen_60_part_01
MFDAVRLDLQIYRSSIKRQVHHDEPTLAAQKPAMTPGIRPALCPVSLPRTRAYYEVKGIL